MTKAELCLEYTRILTWPVIAGILLIIYRKAFTALLGRIQRLEIAGLGIQTFEKQIEEVETLARERQQERQQESEVKEYKQMARFPNHEVNQRMIELGLKPSLSGLDVDFYNELAKKNPKRALAYLHIDLGLMLQNLAKGFSVKITGDEPTKVLSKKLLDKSAVTFRQYQLINAMLEIAEVAFDNIEVKAFQAREIFDIMQVIIDDYKAWLWTLRK